MPLAGEPGNRPLNRVTPAAWHHDWVSVLDHSDLPKPGEPGGRIDIEGTLNFRELGGYQSADGRTVKRGQVFRSDHLNDVTDEGRERMTSLGIRTIVDLRFPVERERQPSRVPAEVTTVNAHPDGMEAADQSVFMELIQSGGLSAYSVEDAAADYRKMVVDGVGLVVETLSVIANTERQPVLFHCTAGKDRTGLTAALLLRLLDVPDTAVMNDYLLTNPYRSVHRIAAMKPVLAAKGVDINQVVALFQANRTALAAALDEIDLHGGTEPFLLSHGLATDIPARLRDELLA
jgi:protein-tyrosine phosphatase